MSCKLKRSRLAAPPPRALRTPQQPHSRYRHPQGALRTSILDDSPHWGEPGGAGTAPLPNDLQAWLDQQERDILIRALKETGFNRTATAARLGVSLRQIRYRIARLNIGVPNDQDFKTRSAEMAGLQSVWEGGWHRGAVRLPSPDFGPAPWGPCRWWTWSSCIPSACRPGNTALALCSSCSPMPWIGMPHPYYQQIKGLQVSAHFFIERNGRLWQFVDCDQRAWHAGQSFYRGRANCNDDSIGIELEGLEGLAFESARYEALGELCRDLIERYPLHYVAGHEHVAQAANKTPAPASTGPSWAANCP